MQGDEVISSANQPHEETFPRSRTLVVAPRDYFLGPVFAATKQTGPREVTVRVKNEIGEIIERRYQVGGFSPLRGAKYIPPALDVRHARAVFSLLSFRKQFEETRLIRFSFNEFCKRYANSNGGRYAREISSILSDLLYAFIRITDTKTDISHSYRIIEHIDIEERPPRRKDAVLAKSNQLEMWFNGCTLSKEFFDLLSQIAELQNLKLDVFTSIRSPLAQSIYLYIPSRAVHHSEAKPFEITLTNLLQQVSAEVPAHKSKRKEIFTQHTTSILSQLDGVETLTGIFRVKLANTSDKSDWKLQAWVEKNGKILPSQEPKEDSKLLKAFLKGGRTREEWTRLVIQPLSDYELDLLQTAKIDPGKHRRFLEKTKAILREWQFDILLAEAKCDEQEGKKAKKNSTARLIFRLMEAIGQTVKPNLK